MGGVGTSMLCSPWLLILVSGMVTGIEGAVTSSSQSRLSLPMLAHSTSRQLAAGTLRLKHGYKAQACICAGFVAPYEYQYDIGRAPYSSFRLASKFSILRPAYSAAVMTLFPASSAASYTGAILSLYLKSRIK